MQNSTIGLPLRIVYSIFATVISIIIAIAIAVTIPFLLGMILPPSWGIYAMYLLTFFTAMGVAMLFNLLYQKYHWFGLNTFMTAVIVGSFALTIATLANVRDVYLPRLLDVDINQISTREETMVLPLPFFVVTDEVNYSRETFHRAKYSRHQCTYTYVMPLCSVATGCKEDTWLADEFSWNIGVLEDCDDVPEPNWEERAETTWLRVTPATAKFEALTKGDSIFFSPAQEPSASGTAVFTSLLPIMKYIALVVGALLVIDILYAVIKERRSEE